MYNGRQLGIQKALVIIWVAMEGSERGTEIDETNTGRMSLFDLPNTLDDGLFYIELHYTIVLLLY